MTEARRTFKAGRTVLIVVLVVVATGVGWALNATLSKPQTSTIMTVPATVGDVEEAVLATGILKPLRLVAVGAQVSGRVTAMKVAAGQQVKKDDLIAEIDSIAQQNSLRTAQATLESYRAQRAEKLATLAHAESSLARQQVTFAQKASSRADYESAEATVKTTKAQIASLDAQIVQYQIAIETAGVNLGYTRITAPIDGTVLAVVTQEGQTVNSVQSTPTIVIVGDLDTMVIRAEISEADVVRVKPGQPVYFTILGDRDHRYEATLESIEPAPESIKNDSSFSSSSATSSSSSSSTSSGSSSSSAIYYNGIFQVPNADRRLRTYMTAEVRIVVGKANGVLTVPTAALSGRQSDGTYVVQVAEPSGADFRSIKVGLRNNSAVEVLSGLREGDRVVTGRIAGQKQPSRMPGPPPIGF